MENVFISFHTSFSCLYCNRITGHFIKTVYKAPPVERCKSDQWTLPDHTKTDFHVQHKLCC